MAFNASGAFGLTLRDILKNTTAVDLDSDSIKAALFTNSLTTPNFDTNTAYAAAPFNANEVSGTGYSAGGAALSGLTVVVASPVATQLNFDANDLSWASATFSSVRGVLVYDDTIASPTAKPGIVAITFGADFSVTGGTFTIQWNANGIFTLDYA
ncbi:MAG TPA: hypothetical protein VHC63_13305 [Acidimicrobiales bacterium]|nr:hypothetical protein [Acidimicrobiales bacterium]